MAATPVCSIDDTGIHRPDFAAVLAYFKAAFRSIYGADTYLENDCQDGQWVALLATAFHDQNGATVAAYNARSPVSARGAGLSSIVKINGIERLPASYSSADLRIVGQAGTLIEDGAATDDAQQRWVLPASVTIPVSGEITVTATADTLGAISAPAGTITTIATQVPGWQTVSNPAAATRGLPVETDAALRQRQVMSTRLAARTALQGTTAALAGLDGVARVRSYENDTDHTDGDGLPGHSVAHVVDGGDAYTIAGTIQARKGAVGTYGSTVIPVGDALQVPKPVAFSRPRSVPVTYAIRLKALAGYDLDVQADIQDAVATWTEALGIGAGPERALLRTRAYGPALLPGNARARTFDLVGIAVARDGGTPRFQDVPFAYDEAPTCPADSVAITVVP